MKLADVDRRLEQALAAKATAGRNVTRLLGEIDEQLSIQEEADALVTRLLDLRSEIAAGRPA